MFGKAHAKFRGDPTSFEQVVGKVRPCIVSGRLRRGREPFCPKVEPLRRRTHLFMFGKAHAMFRGNPASFEQVVETVHRYVISGSAKPRRWTILSQS